VIPTRRLALVAAVVAVALWFYPGPLVGGTWGTLAIANVALLFVALVDGRIAVPPGTIRVVRRHPPVVVMGHSATIAWHVANPSGRAVNVDIADELQPSLRAAVMRTRLSIPARASGVATSALSPTRRGRFVLSGLVVRTTGPLGLMHRQARRVVPGVLRVHPPFKSKAEAELKIRHARMLEVGLRSARGAGGGTEFESLREYGPDDEFRRIDWAASARSGRTIVRTYRPEQNQTVIVMLDNGRLGAARVDDVPRLEHHMDAAIMLTAVASRLGDKVGLVTFDQQVRSVLAPARRTDQVMAATEAMYDLEPVLAESDYRGAVEFVLARIRRRSLLLLLTDLQPEVWDQSLFPVMPMLVRRHLVVVGSVRDPMVASWATSVVQPARGLVAAGSVGGSGDEDGPYRSVAAIRDIEDRARIERRLRSMGVTVVDAVPGRLAGALTDTYLHVKSTGRL